MTRLLAAMLGRLPIGWLQLIHNPNRLAAALAGVAFANLLMFMQLGFLGALQETTHMPYRALNADFLISGIDANTLADGSSVPRNRMYQALAVSGISSASPLYMGKLDWQQNDGERINLHVMGVDPQAVVFSNAELRAQQSQLRLLDRALIDRATRNLEKGFFKTNLKEQPLEVELNGRSIQLVGNFKIGASFEADGYLIVSDQTFLKLFPKRSAGAPNHILLQALPNTDLNALERKLQNRLPPKDSQVRQLTNAALADQHYQTTERPVGVVFGFGVTIGVLVGIIIVYQVLSTDVADHISEYATFKAMGYPPRFFLSIVFEEAMILALLGFIPGLALSLVLYELVANGTGIPLAMNSGRAIMVLLGTLVMCIFSGALATRRLTAADPADLF